MRVEVTAEDVRAGERWLCAACPVALALRRATGQTWEVGHWRAKAGDGRTYTLSLAVQRWLWHFDYGRPVEPFAFDVLGPRARLYLVNKVAGRHGELLVDEVPGGGVTNIRQRPGEGA